MTNSEVGLARVQVSGIVFRTICLNGLIMRGGSEEWQRRHIGYVNLADEVRKAINRVQEAAATGTNRFAGLQGIRVPNMAALFDRISKHFELSVAEHETVVAACVQFLLPKSPFFCTISKVWGIQATEVRGRLVQPLLRERRHARSQSLRRIHPDAVHGARLCRAG